MISIGTEEAAPPVLDASPAVSGYRAFSRILEWQSIILAEFDGPRSRSLAVQVCGV